MPVSTMISRQARPAGTMGRYLTGALIIAMACLFPAERSSAADVSFQRHFPAGIGFMNSFPTALQTEDLDGDGDLDVVAVSKTADELTWYENDGAPAPAFARHPIVSNINVGDAPGGPVSVFAADLDGDGDLDLLTAGITTGKIAWYENQGGPSPAFLIASTTRIGTVASPRSVFAADLDGDLDVDVLSASFDDDRIAWYENNGASPPAFTTHTIVDLSSGADRADGATGVFAGDLDGDGDLDVLSVSGNDDKVAWYENDGAVLPGFTPRTITTTADSAIAVTAADLDGDGDLDAVSASNLDDTIAWYENDGATTPAFTPRVVSTAHAGPLNVTVADVDGDGDPDLVSRASGLGHFLVWHENLGNSPLTFTTRLIDDAIFSEFCLSAGDLDGDGDTDIITAFSVPDTLIWHENLNPPATIPAFNARAALLFLLLLTMGWAWRRRKSLSSGRPRFPVSSRFNR